MGSLAGVSLIGRTRPSSFVLARPPKRAERSPVRSYGRIKMTIIGPFQPQKDRKKDQKKKGIYVIQANSEWQRLSRHMHVGCEESQCRAAATRTLWSFAHPCQRAAVLRGTSDTYFPFFFLLLDFSAHRGPWPWEEEENKWGGPPVEECEHTHEPVILHVHECCPSLHKYNSFPELYIHYESLYFCNRRLIELATYMMFLELWTNVIPKTWISQKKKKKIVNNFFDTLSGKTHYLITNKKKKTLLISLWVDIMCNYFIEPPRR